MDLAVAEGLLGIDVVLVGDGAAVLDLPVLTVLKADMSLPSNSTMASDGGPPAVPGWMIGGCGQTIGAMYSTMLPNSCSRPAWLEMASTAANKKAKLAKRIRRRERGVHGEDSRERWERYDKLT